MEDTPTPIAEIDHGPSKFEEFLEENQKKLIIAAILIFVGVLAWVFFSGFSEMKEQNGGEEYTLATTEEEFAAVTKNHPDTAAAAAAMISVADIKAEASSEEAITQLRDVIAKYPEYSGKPLAETNLGLRLFAEGKLDEAEASLGSVVDDENAAFIAPYAKIALADIAVKKGQKDRAKALYNEVADLIVSGDEVTIQKFTTYAELAQERLRLIDAAPPRKVQPTTPAPKTPEATAPVTPKETAPSTPETTTSKIPKVKQEAPKAPTKIDTTPAPKATPLVTPKEAAPLIKETAPSIPKATTPKTTEIQPEAPKEAAPPIKETAPSIPEAKPETPKAPVKQPDTKPIETPEIKKPAENGLPPGPKATDNKESEGAENFR